ncbi:MAG TPA: class I SAM-dependent methyltransferase [Syntrophorhabdaceae bacterium]|nr:class I SAM-dependent methyltransferase [Syntrophorhabdaceae bacterium]
MENEIRDFSLHSGERQTAEELSGIRRDHVVRYEFAESLIRDRIKRKDCTGLDIFCGNGYGTYVLSRAVRSGYVFGVDGSKDAIDMANKCYSLPNNVYSWKIFPFFIPAGSFDFVVCFESLEHVEDGALMLKLVLYSLKKNGIAVISVPNQDIHPLERNPHPFHIRHYSHLDFACMLPDDFIIEDWYGQNVYEFAQGGVNTFRLLPESEINLQRKTAGQTNVYVICRRSSQ